MTASQIVETPRFDFVIRGELPQDEALIMSSWKKSYRECYPHMHSGPFFSAVDMTIRKLRARGLEVLVAHPLDRENYIFGWVAHEGGTLHYAYTREQRRKCGIASALLRVADVRTGPIELTHWTRSAESYAREHPGALVYALSKLKVKK